MTPNIPNTELTSNGTFEVGKQYTVNVTLKPDAGLQFISTTPATINTNAATAVLNSTDGTLTVSNTFNKLSSGGGVVNAFDAAAILMNVISSSVTGKIFADFNFDGVVNELDAAMLLKYVVGIIKELPGSAA